MDEASPVKQGQLQSLWRFVRLQAESHSAFVRFALVGGSGFLLYQAVLFLVYDIGLIWFLPAKNTGADIVFVDHGDVRFLLASLVATPVTLVGVFTGHNLWTFRNRAAVHRPLWMRFVQFVATASIGAVIITVTVNVLTVQYGLYHFVALPIGVALAGVWDWIWYSRFIWRRT